MSYCTSCGAGRTRKDHAAECEKAYPQKRPDPVNPCQRDGPGTAGRHGCPGGSEAVWVVATVPCCSRCLPAVVDAAMRRIQDDAVRVSRVPHGS